MSRTTSGFLLIPYWHCLAPCKVLCDAHAEDWSPEDRAAAAAESQRIKQIYYSKEYAKAVDVIHNFKGRCEARNVNYADAFLSGDMAADEYETVGQSTVCGICRF